VHLVGFIIRKLFLLTLPMKMAQTECSKTLAYKIQMQRNHPKVRLQHSEHGKGLQSTVNTCLLIVFLFACIQSLLVWTFDIERFPFLTLICVKIVLMSSSTLILMCATPCVYSLYNIDSTIEWTLLFQFSEFF